MEGRKAQPPRRLPLGLAAEASGKSLGLIRGKPEEQEAEGRERRSGGRGRRRRRRRRRRSRDEESSQARKDRARIGT